MSAAAQFVGSAQEVQRTEVLPLKPKRPYFKLKSQWCEWEAKQVEEQAERVRAQYVISSDWRGVRNKTQVLSNMRTQASEWRQRGSRYLQLGQ